MELSTESGVSSIDFVIKDFSISVQSWWYEYSTE